MKTTDFLRCSSLEFFFFFQFNAFFDTFYYENIYVERKFNIYQRQMYKHD